MTIIQIPPSLGGTDTPYSDGTGSFGMASQNGYGYARYFMPMLSEVMAAMAIYLSQAAQAGATAGSQAAQPFVNGARDWAQFTGGDVPSTPGARSAKSWSQDDLRGVTFGGSARDWAMGAGLIDGTFYSSRKYSLDAAASASAANTSNQEAADEAAAALADRQAADAQAAAVAGILTQAQGVAQTAQAAAGVAQVAAGQAASVPQQDLSGVINAAMYRSPNGIVTAFAENLKNDRDGGAWRETVGSASWMQEPLTGPQIGAFASEQLARGDNLVQFPEELDNAYWGKANCTITPNASIAPDGTATMDKIVPSTSGSARTVNKANLFSSANVVKSVSVSLKAGEITWAFVGLSSTAVGVFFNLATGAKGDEIGGATGTIVAEANGSYRCTATATTTGRTPAVAASDGNSTTTVTASGTNGIYAWGVKVIEGGPMTAYVPMATMTGKVFQSTADGKYYSLGAGYGALTEALRGNTQKFPREPLFVVEAGRVVILDGAAPGRPMWKVYPLVTGVNASSNGQITSLAYKDGVLCIGATAGSSGLRLLDFAKDKAIGYGINGTTYARIWDGVDYTKHTATAGVSNPTLILSNTVNDVCIFSMPDAPLDVATGLPKPTIAFATASGAAVLQSDGSVVPSVDTTELVSISMNQYMLYAARRNSTGTYIALKPSTLGANFALTLLGNLTTFPDWSMGNSPATASLTKNPMGKRGRLWRNFANGGFAGLVLNEADPTLSLSYKVSDTFNTGLMLKPIRAWACSTTPGTVDGAEKITDGTFSGGTLPAGWTVPTANATATVVGGQLQVVSSPGSLASDMPYYTITGLTAGQQYALVYDWITKGGSGRVYVGNAPGQAQYDNATTSGLGKPVPFTPTQSTVFITVGEASGGTGATNIYDNFTCKAVITDRSNKGKNLTVNGVLTKTAVAAAAQAVFFGNFSASNYGVEAYSADWDFGTGAWSIRQPMVVPSTLPAAMFPVISSVSLAGGWVNGVGASGFDTFATSGGTQITATRTGAGGTEYALAGAAFTVTAGEFYRYNAAVSANTYVPANPGFGLANGAVPRSNLSTPIGTGALSGIMTATATGTANLRLSSTAIGSITVDGVTLDKVGPSVLLERSAAGGGASIKWGLNPDGTLTATVTDSVGGTRTVTTTVPYNTGLPIVPELVYTTDGTLTIKVNGQVAAQATGTPLGSMSNASATVTWGNSRDLTAPFPGQLAMTIAQAAAPTPEQSVFAYEQQKAMFQPGAQITLPDSGAVVDLDYDSALDRVKCTSAAYECSFNGLVRVESNAVSAGSFTKGSLRNGVKLMARSGTSPGVDYSQASLNLREELDKRAEEAARLARPPQMRVFRATSGQTTFPLSVGDELSKFFVAGALKTEGAADDYTVGFDGFKPTVTYPSGAAVNAVVSIEVRRAM